MWKKIEVLSDGEFSISGVKRNLVFDSPYFKIINFNISAGHSLPVHSHEIEGQLSIVVLAGSGYFLGGDGKKETAKEMDILISDISEPHGVEAETDMRILVTIAPPI